MTNEPQETESALPRRLREPSQTGLWCQTESDPNPSLSVGLEERMVLQKCVELKHALQHHTGSNPGSATERAMTLGKLFLWASVFASAKRD